MTTINIIDAIYVQYGTLKQKLRPWGTKDDLDFLINLGVAPDDCIKIDLSVCSDDNVQVGLTVERLKRELKFGIPGTATAFRNGLPLGNDAQVLPGDVIEFVRRRASKKMRSPLQQKAPSDAALAHEDEDHDDSKLVLSGFTARFKGQKCFLGNTKPFALLVRLNRRPGWYVSVPELKEDICGVDSPVNDNTIQKHASDLRTQLRNAGMDGIEIDGKVKGHYRLVLT
jgi:hypothetical protein